MNRKYDAIVIGAGQAGPSFAARLAGAGKSVAIIERHLFGGTCVNSGCTPTKTLISSARIAYDARRAHDYGIELATAGIVVDMRAVQARKRRIVDARTDLILGASILGVGGDEAIHSIIDVMAAKVPYTTLQRTVHIHPTVSELIPTILSELGPTHGISA